MATKDIGMGMTPSYVDMAMKGAIKRSMGRYLNSIALISAKKKSNMSLHEIKKLRAKGMKSGKLGLNIKAERPSRITGKVQ